MRINHYLCFLGLLLSGCASTVELESIDEAQAKINDHSAIIHLKSDDEYWGKNVQVGNDSIQFVDKETDDTLRYSNMDIEYIKVTNHTLGAVKGFFILGVSFYALLTITDNSRDYNVEGNKPTPPIFTAIFAGVGGILGLAIGGLIGHPFTYILPEDSVNVGKGIFIDSTINSSQQILKSAP